MEKITAILRNKKPNFHKVSPHTTVSNALSQMCCENIDYLVVLDEEERFIGLITEHDITSKVVFTGKEMNKIKVKDIMEKRVPAATTEDTVENCMQLMRQHNVRYLPVFENFLFYGVVSSEDILEEAVKSRREIFDADNAEKDLYPMLI
jgi:signal-transduction protein with cAMP-binding, CBS, and nucleotidyltransferase domain